MRYVSITTYAKMCGISRESVYKRIKKGTAVLLPNSEVAVIDTWKSKGLIQRNSLKNISEDNNTPSWMND